MEDEVCRIVTLCVRNVAISLFFAKTDRKCVTVQFAAKKNHTPRLQSENKDLICIFLD